MHEYTGVFAGLGYSQSVSAPSQMDSPSGIPWAEYVSALVTRSYGGSPETRQAIFDALSPFQMISKMWAAEVLSYLSSSVPYSEYLYVGSWFGQLAVVQQSTEPESRLDFAKASKVFLDKDCEATAIANSTAVPLLYKSRALTSDIFDYQGAITPATAVVWPGVEHFDSDKVREFIKKFQGQAITFLLQGTNMPADDHTNPINSVSELGQYFHKGRMLYHGQLKTTLGTRFMVAYST